MLSIHPSFLTGEKMNNLLLEIGTEEIPAGYINPALKALVSGLSKKLTETRIEHGSTQTFGTPKRLAVVIRDIADKQTSITTEVTGPPEKVGFDENGKPTMAAIKFAEKVGISVKKINVCETKKGRYLCAVKTEKGTGTKNILKTILPEVIASLPFPKTMRWADLKVSFARPVQSVLALLGKSVVSFEYGNLKSNRFTYGHRFMKPGRIKIEEPAAYIDTLRSASVIADMDERKKRVMEEISKAAEGAGGTVLADDELVDIVTNLVEYPVAVAGRFDTKFLELPGEVLITSMREHQKYFAVVDEDGKLMSCFIAVNNTRAKDMAVVAKGHERVLWARLEDAMFFYKSDLDVSLESRVDKLKGVLFQAKLGSVFEKIKRVQLLGEFLAETVGEGPDLKKNVSRAIWLCKADLVSQVVVEFPKLQGVMGRVYAKKANESEKVAAAIEEHYRPTYSGGKLPDTITGAITGISDKMDSICGCFSAGLIPTGASDPYALRRQGIGIIQIMHDKQLTFSLRELIEKSALLFNDKSELSLEEITGKVYTFFQDRISHLLADERFSKDVIASVASVSIDHIPDVWNRVSALEKLKQEPDFDSLAIAFKRVVNIIKKAEKIEEKQVNESLFEDACESALLSAYRDVRNKVEKCLQNGDFNRALHEIATLRSSVDTFFDGVMVLADDENLRNNRLALLGRIATLFENIADFSKIST